MREPLIKSTISHVAVKFEMVARRIVQVVAAHGRVTGVASRLREVRLSHLSRTCATRYRVEVATLRCQAMQHSNRTRKEYHHCCKPASWQHQCDKGLPHLRYGAAPLVRCEKNTEQARYYCHPCYQLNLPWHCLYFLPEPQGQGSLRPIFMPSRSKGMAADAAAAAASAAPKPSASS